jgi:hypothetical protein
MPACNTNFQSKYANLDGIGQVNISDYIDGKYKTNRPRCIPNGHELIPVNCTKRQSHFRHKHNADMEGNPMTEWHSEWQSNFPITEVSFKNKYNQIKDRRADVVISDFKRIVEIQHSKFETNGEVANRNSDYKLHGYNVIWIIHGQDSIIIKKIGNRLILEFINNHWLYEDFFSCDTVYYDIDGFIYVLNPNQIRSHQIDVCEPKLKDDFIDSLKENENVWIKEEPNQSYLYVKQKGAGSGKTYGMMQLLNRDPEITHFKYIIFITKQHAAVNVMYTEFMNQYNDNELYNIQMINDPKDHKRSDDKKFIVNYKHRITNVESYAIFATVDSFAYAIGTPSKNVSNQFESIVKSISEGFSKVKRSGTLSFAGMNPIINKETIVMIDETQDLSEVYGEAFLKFVSTTHTNLCVVGDRLQSLSNFKNALTFLHRAEAVSMKSIKEEASNIVRRFSNPRLINFVNSVIPFEKYDLPPMKAAKLEEEKSEGLVIFEAKTIYADKSADDLDVIKAVLEIMDLYKKEVDTYNRVPEDFLIVTPFTSKNPLVEALQLAIILYWKEIMEQNISYIENVKNKHPYWKNINPSEYTRYAVFHKSQEMGSINLGESEHTTRMVSIHSSKGDGRKVVFVIGVTQSALQKFSNIANNLIYDSLFHVAITRQKEHLYFRLEANGDDIHKRISDCNVEIKESTNTEFDFASSIVKLEYISRNLLEFDFDRLYTNIICKNQPPVLPPQSEQKLLIDMGDHNIRYASMFMNVIVHICNHEQKTKSDTKHQFYALLTKLKMDMVRPVFKWNDYIKILEDNNKKNKADSKDKNVLIPILNFTEERGNKIYIRYYNIIIFTIERIIEELKSIGKGQMNYFCPLESIILYYMLECIKQGKFQEITINDVYNIIDTYSKVFDEGATGHEHCRCKVHFSEPIKNLTDKQKKQQEYLRNHYDRLNHISSILDIFSKTHPNINWLYQHPTFYSGGLQDDNDNFKIKTGYPLIGYDDKTTYVFNIKPQFNDLNFNQVIVDTICDTWMLYNCSNDKFKEKNIVSCVLSLDRSQLYQVDWTVPIIEHRETIINLVYEYIYNSFSVKHLQYFNTFKCVIKEISGSSKIIEYCKSQSEGEVDYIDTFWKAIDGQLTLTQKENRKDIIIKYSNKDTFADTLDKYLDKSLMSYLCMEDEDD